jgi:hypothetical protein
MNPKFQKIMNYGLIVAIMLIMAVNSYQIFALNNTPAEILKRPTDSIIPQGIPSIYGTELGVSFDDVSPSDPGKADATIRKLSTYENIVLDAKQKQRYVKVLYTLNGGMSCEYCCGARSVIFESGERACGCAHSYAMRGLTKYLITQHSEEYTDEELQSEIGKWKTLFFPSQIAQKAELFRTKGIDVNIVDLTSNKYQGIEKQTSSGMVGGC